ncbi:MAG TPA: hypothetical protein VFB74_33960 [Kribbellaceae bacterium]|nr:hypothetical protein [Kribbellaceae bacterium]
MIQITERHWCGQVHPTMTEVETCNAADIERQYEQCARWASLLWAADYPTELRSSGEAAPFDKEWVVFGPGWNGPRVASIIIDGCGASWHGSDELWLKVIGPSEGVTK